MDAEANASRTQPQPRPRPRLKQGPFGFTVTLVPGVKEAAGGLSRVLWDPDGEISPKTKELVFLRSSIVNHCVG